MGPKLNPMTQSFEKVGFKTQDGVEIAGNFYAADNPKLWALLLHMMPAAKESYEELALSLQKENIASLAIDLRGHGESIHQQGRKIDYRHFTDLQHQDSIFDLQAAVDFLKSKAVPKDKIILIGASIGANLSLWYMTEHSDIKKAVLLSPGLDYRGIKALPLMAKLQPGQSLLLVGSNNDSLSDSKVMQALREASPRGVELKVLVYRSAGHGTNMFGKETPDLTSEILNWLK